MTFHVPLAIVAEALATSLKTALPVPVLEPKNVTNALWLVFLPQQQHVVFV